MKNLLLIPILLLSASLFANTYYVSPNGADHNPGTLSQPWKTAKKASSVNFNGDTVLFMAPYNYTNMLQPKTGNVTFGSYGSGRATLAGFSSTNQSNITLMNLIFVFGAGNNGITFYNNGSAQQYNINIINVEVSGYKADGINIGSWNTTYGYTNVHITGCKSHDNVRNGIESYSQNDAYAHSNFVLDHDTTYNNLGDPTITSHATGSGIVIAGVANALIQYCESYKNGNNNACTTGGPVAIWIYDCKNSTIQYCFSHDQSSGKAPMDGGGFDIDGGSQYCTVQYCKAKNNAGYGYLICEFGSVNQNIGNKIVYNVSITDGLKNYNAYGVVFYASKTIYNGEFGYDTIYTTQTAGPIDFVNRNYSNLTVVGMVILPPSQAPSIACSSILAVQLNYQRLRRKQAVN